MNNNRTTELLRKLLDERSVKWWETIWWENCIFTWWESPTFGTVHALDNNNGETLFMACMNNCDFTPEQAIAATLGNYPTKSGRGYYTDRDGEGTHIMCDDCGGYIGTAEEIAATLWSGTCEMVLMWSDYEDGECYKCSKCGDFAFTCGGEPRFCPNCGAKVVKRMGAEI